MNLRSYAVTGEQRYLSARRNELVEPDELVYQVLVTRSSERINFKQGAMLVVKALTFGTGNVDATRVMAELEG